MPQHSSNPVGRPRAVPREDATADPKEDILRAAASLFVRQGFGGTSTRAIAEIAGMRQATLYYYFSGKDDILRTLLAETVRPSLEMAKSWRVALRGGQDAAVVLYRLIAEDTRILRSAGRQVGALYALPEVWSGNYPEFVEEHAVLEGIYSEVCELLLARTEVTFAIEARQLGRLCCQLAENAYLFSGPVQTVADTMGCLGLRLNGVPDAAVEFARR